MLEAVRKQSWSFKKGLLKNSYIIDETKIDSAIQMKSLHN